MTNNECQLLHLIETAGKSFTQIARRYSKSEELTSYDRFMLNETVKFVELIPEAVKKANKSQ